MKRNKIYTLLIAMLFFACSKETLKVDDVEINFSIGFANDIMVISKTTDVSFKTTFEKGDAIGMFVYKRDQGQESSIERNKIYADNIRMTYDGRSWISESPIYFTNDGTLLDIYAYYPYSAGAKAGAISYNASSGMANFLAVSAIGIEKINTFWAIPILFNNVLSMVHLSINKDITDQYASGSAYFNGIIGGTYNFSTEKINNPVNGVSKMIETGTTNTQEKTYIAWVPAQQIAPQKTIFSISGTGTGFSTVWETPETITLAQDEISKFQITSSSQMEKIHEYKKYEQYPKHGTPIGMVIEVSNNRRNGKIIALKNSGNAQWATNNVFVACDDVNNGQSNTMKIQTLNNWTSNYPAFGLLDHGWYIPSIMEIHPLIKNIKELNEHLLKIPGGMAINTWESYWTSTESSAGNANSIRISNADINTDNKGFYRSVRPFYQF